jgi:hypothetical protein
MGKRNVHSVVSTLVSLCKDIIHLLFLLLQYYTHSCEDMITYG